MRVPATLILSFALTGCAAAPPAPRPAAMHLTLVRPLDGWPALDAAAAEGRRDEELGRSGPPLILSEDVRIRELERRWTANGRVRERSHRSVWSERRTGVTNPQRP